MGEIDDRVALSEAHGSLSDASTLATKAAF